MVVNAIRPPTGKGYNAPRCREGAAPEALAKGKPVIFQSPARRSCDVLDALPLGRDKEGDFSMPFPKPLKTQ